MKKTVVMACPCGENELGILSACESLDVKALLLRDDPENHSVLLNNLGVIHAKKPLTMPIAWGGGKPVLVHKGLATGEEQKLHCRGERLPGTGGPPPEILPEHAWELLWRVAKNEGKITLVCLSSLSDLAIALFAHEELYRYINRIVVMGGTADVGDVSAYGEAHLYEDPYGAEAVVRSGIPVDFVGLEFARKHSGATHDVWTVAAAREPERFSWREYAASVEYKSSLCMGRLNLDIRKHCDDPKTIRMAEKADEDFFASGLEGL